jgi:hypothetical protein
MLNFLHRKSQFFLSILVFTVTSTTVLIAPVRGENITVNREQSEYLSPKVDYNSHELVELLNSENIKFNLLEHTYDFTPSFLNTEAETTNFTQANEYSLTKDLKISEFKQSGNIDFAVAQ